MYLLVLNVAQNNPNSSNGLLEWRVGEITALRAIRGDSYKQCQLHGWHEPRTVEVTDEVASAILAADWTGEMTPADVEGMVREWGYPSRAEAEKARQEYLGGHDG